MERAVRHFQEELEGLQARLLEMGGLAEERVRGAVHGLVTRDTALIDRVMRGDEPINELHIEIDNRCFTLLALYQPMATDLRSIVAAVKINTDLERVGDLAVNIAEAARRYANHAPVKKLIDIPQMGDIAQAMLRDALDSFVRRDTRLAHQVLNEDDRLDALKTQVFRELLTYMLDDPSTVEPALPATSDVDAQPPNVNAQPPNSKRPNLSGSRIQRRTMPELGVGTWRLGVGNWELS
jgi:phosphate transport system protein